MDFLCQINRKRVKCYPIVPDNVIKPCEQFIKEVKKTKSMKTKKKPDKCEAVIHFCVVVSRVGTDIQAAEKTLEFFMDLPIAIVVLHHTFDPEIIVPDSKRIVRRANTITVDCLFQEETGLLHCSKNNDSINEVADWLEDVVQAQKDAKRMKEHDTNKMLPDKESRKTNSNKIFNSKVSPEKEKK